MYRFQSFAILAGIVGLFALVAYSLFGWTGVVLIIAGSLIFNLFFPEWICADDPFLSSRTSDFRMGNARVASHFKKPLPCGQIF